MRDTRVHRLLDWTMRKSPRMGTSGCKLGQVRQQPQWHGMQEWEQHQSNLHLINTAGASNARDADDSGA
jgi:hypothetical protein